MGKRFAVMILFTVILAGCGNNGADHTLEQQNMLIKENTFLESGAQKETETSAISESLTEQNTENEKAETDIAEQEDTMMEEGQENMIHIQVGDTLLTAELCENSSADALKEMLAQGSLTIEMSDYGNFEKVGPIGATLPRNDEQITTEPGDIILYQGNSITIYYDTNSWNFTRLGKIIGMTGEELREVLGTGDVEVIFSLP